jgi:hypothetical protein
MGLKTHARELAKLTKEARAEYMRIADLDEDPNLKTMLLEVTQDLLRDLDKVLIKLEHAGAGVEHVR